jgi:hypothetical protein
MRYKNMVCCIFLFKAKNRVFQQTFNIPAYSGGAQKQFPD